MDILELKAKIESMLKQAQADCEAPFQEEDEYAMNGGKVLALEEVLDLFKQ